MTIKTMNKTGVQNEKVTHIRNYDYEVVCGSAGSTFPDEYEIPRDNTGYLRNQKYMNCVANVIAQIAEDYWGGQSGEEEPHSVGFTYGSLRDSNSTGEGMIVSVAMDLWAKIGTIPEKYFNIDAEMPENLKVTRFGDLVITDLDTFRQYASAAQRKEVEETLQLLDEVG